MRGLSARAITDGRSPIVRPRVSRRRSRWRRWTALVGEAISVERLSDCVNVILSYQNRSTGGWATYENTRSYAWVEWLNPAETFGDIMIDYPSWSVRARVCRHCANFRAIPRRSSQGYRSREKDGSRLFKTHSKTRWKLVRIVGGVFHLRHVVRRARFDHRDRLRACPALRKAVEFLLSKQQANGGWGESYLSCEKKTYHELLDAEGNPTPHLVNTGWATLALIASGQASRDAGAVAPRRAMHPLATVRKRGFPATEHHGCLQRQLYDLVQLLQKHIPALGARRVRVQSRRRREMNAKNAPPRTMVSTYFTI